MLILGFVFVTCIIATRGTVGKQSGWDKKKDRERSIFGNRIGTENQVRIVTRLMGVLQDSVQLRH